MDLAEEVHAAMFALRMASPSDDSGVWTGLTEEEAAHIRANLDRTVAAAQDNCNRLNTLVGRNRT